MAGRLLHRRQEAQCLVGSFIWKSALSKERQWLSSKTNPESPFEGRWHIVSVTEFDEDCINLEGQGFIELDASDGGKFQFGYWRGDMDCRLTKRDDEPAVEWSWEGFEEMEPEGGSGWAVLKGDELHGVIAFNDGEEYGFVAKRAAAPKSSRRKKRGE